MTTTIDWSPENLTFGFFDADRAPVASIASGDEVVFHCLPAAARSALPADGAGVIPAHLAALDFHEPRQGATAHMISGPVAVAGAEPGDVLQVDILEAVPAQDWGYTAIKPLLGALPDDFAEAAHMHIPIDRDRNICRLPWGLELPLDPFFGIMAVAPPKAWGRVGAAEPRAFGGNMDNKELKPGTTLYLPVFQEGALFMAGDGHGCQGDGEVCLTGLETALTGRFRLTIRKDMSLAMPFAENASHLISMGFHESLDEAMRRALRQMIDMVADRTGLSRSKAYMLLSLAGDLRITQVVDGEKGVHMMIAKS
ncbi:MAG: acetamidase/formamidase family protein, partial [Pseudomonadota bacterium]